MIPRLRLLWVIGNIVHGFYAITRSRTTQRPPLASAILVAITIPLWDRHIPAELRVEGTLWAVGQTIIAGA